MAPFDPVPKLSVADQIAQRLRDEILTGRIPAGEHLPPERELAVRLGTNRGTLREAIGGLEALGLVRVRQGEGVVVRDFRREGQLHLLPAFVVGAASAAERGAAVADALRIRAVILAEGAALVAERARPRDRTRIEAAFREAVAAAREGDLLAVARADLAFYRAFLDATRSVVATWAFNTFIRTFEDIVSRMPELWVLPPGYVRSLSRVMRAIRARRPEAARRAVKAHLLEGDRRIVRILKKKERGT